MKTFKITIRYKDEPTQKPRSYYLNAESKKRAMEIVRKTNEGKFTITCTAGQIIDGYFWPI